MIIRKPYAFLIKRFRLIHAIMFILSIYIFFSCYKLYTFFNDLAKGQITTFSAELVTISAFVFISIIILSLLLFILFYLLKDKKKPYKFYILSLAYYVYIFIFIIIVYNQIKLSTDISFSFEKIRVIRDLCLLFFLPQAYIIIFLLIRALGFNIKVFDFQKDVSGLNIDEKDAEEIEIILEGNYLYKRIIRKTIRHLKYFAMENKFTVTIIASICVFIISLSLLFGLKEYNKYYNEQQLIEANSIYYKVFNAYYTNKDTLGNVINDKVYILVKINLRNKKNHSIELTRDSFRLVVNEKMLNSIPSYQEKFIDMGEVYKPLNLKSGSNKDYLLIFEIDEKDLKREYILRIKTEFMTLDSKYKDVIVKVKKLEKEKESQRIMIPCVIDFNDTILKENKLMINSYEIRENFEEEYISCIYDECSTFKYIIKPKKQGNVLIKINSQIQNNYDEYIDTHIDDEYNFYKYFTTISYRVYGYFNEKETIVINNPKIKTDNTFIEVPNEILSADKINLNINVRGNKYTIVLK